MTRKRQRRIKVGTILPRGISLLAIFSRTNMAGKLFLFLGLAAVVRGAVVPAVPAAVAPLAKLEEFDAVPQYSFAYDVQDAITGDSKAQYETRNGDIVRGSYSLIEADGTRRIVEYTADPINGFNAVVSREPATATAAVAAVATPVLSFRPAALTPIAPITPVAASPPSIPAVGPDSDVEVVEARTGRLRAKSSTREQEIQRQQVQQLQRLQDQQRQQQQEQHVQQLQQLQEQQRQSSRLQIQQQQRQLLLQQRQQQSQVQVERQQQQQQQEQQQAVAPARTIIAGKLQQPIANGLVSLPATAARATATYPSYPYISYSAAYSSPFAYAAPLTGLAYAPSAATAAAPA